MPEYEYTVKISNAGSRNQVRKRILEVFLKEKPGKGPNELASRYTYFVEALMDGKRIFVRRPAYNYKGFDFVIRVENTDFSKGKELRSRSNPKHDDLYEDLREKKRDNPSNYKKLYRLIDLIYNCKNISRKEYSDLSFSCGYTVDLILGVFKWFFIEQDIRDWSYSGRDMCYSGIPKP